LPDAVDGEQAGPARQASGRRLSVPAAAAGGAEPGPPRDDTERAVAAHWRKLLDCPVEERTADFFALGGDSLLAVRMLGSLAR
ncbi:hypothetical protein B7767_27515, partial [Streptomyces sp. 13-12-16]|uniref:phosphopantetheine-binding protein n=2 Tax=unclassified Streptomyces TaxID=2593676 RepID=UPI000A2411C0